MNKNNDTIFKDNLTKYEQKNLDDMYRKQALEKENRRKLDIILELIEVIIDFVTSFLD